MADLQILAAARHDCSLSVTQELKRSPAILSFRDKHLYGTAKLRPTAVLDAQYDGFTAGSSTVSWGSIDCVASAQCGQRRVVK